MTPHEAHRTDLLALTELARRDLAAMFRRWDSPDATRDGLRASLPRLVAAYGSAAVALAADYYEDVRALTGARRRFRAVPAEQPDVGRTDALARWGVTPLYAAEPDYVAALALVGGGLQRIVANAGRETVIASLAADPDGRGWQRQTSGATCGFCTSIANGGVYSYEADFNAHDYCDCIAVPVFE